MATKHPMPVLNTSTLGLGDIILAANLLQREADRYHKEAETARADGTGIIDGCNYAAVLDGYATNRTETADRFRAIADDWDAQMERWINNPAD